MTHPIITPTLKTGNEPFTSESVETDSTFNLKDYWTWSSSDLISNTQRGILAEFIVKQALGDESNVRIGWDAYDITTANGVKVEVKSASYIQSWFQKELSKISFDIAPKNAWDSATNTVSKIKVRSADLYVFAILNHKDQKTINPLNLDQWLFYVLKTSVLNEKCPEQKTIGLSSLKKLGAVESNWGGLRKFVK